MAIKTKFNMKQSNGKYETYHFETDASQIITNTNQLFCSQSEKNTWNSKETTSGAQAKADAAKNSAISSAKAYTDSVANGKANANHTHNYEPAFTKNNAFNKSFGTSAGTVAEGNHSHSGYAASNHTHSNYALTSHTHSEYASTNHSHSNYLSTNGGWINGSITGNAYNAGEVHFKGEGGEVNCGLYMNRDGRVGIYDWRNNRGVFQYNSGSGITDFSTTCVFHGRLRADGGIHMGPNNDRIGRDGSVYLFDVEGHWRNSQLQTGQMLIQPWSTEGTAFCVNRDGERTNGRTDLTIVPSSNNYGILGRSSRYWYIGWATSWRAASYRESKYDIMKTDDERLYQYVKDINIYNYRRISGNPEDEKKPTDYRGDLQMGAMVNELPFEVVDYDTEHGEGKSVDLYSYSSMIAGALKVAIKKIEDLEEKVNGFIQE